MGFFQRSKYHAILSEDDESEKASSFEAGLRPARSDWKQICCTASTYVMLLTWPPICLVTIWLMWTTAGNKQPMRSLQTVSSYSPALSAVRLYDADFVNGFVQMSPYRGPPTVEREQLWNELWKRPEIIVPFHGMAELNRTDLSDYRTGRGKGGQEGYVAGLEVYHQLHCLNKIREFTWHLMDGYTDEIRPDSLNQPLKNLRIHTDHCIESLRIALMCHGDVSVVLRKWDRSYDPPRSAAEFSSHHRCRNFQQIADWNEEHSLDYEAIFGGGGE